MRPVRFRTQGKLKGAMRRLRKRYVSICDIGYVTVIVLLSVQNVAKLLSR